MGTDNQLANENEAVESVIANARKEIDYGEGVLLHLTGKRANEIFNRIESAHRREVEELRDVGKQMLRRWCNLACTCEHCEFNAEPCSRWRKILEGENDGK